MDMIGKPWRQKKEQMVNTDFQLVTKVSWIVCLVFKIRQWHVMKFFRGKGDFVGVVHLESPPPIGKKSPLD